MSQESVEIDHDDALRARGAAGVAQPPLDIQKDANCTNSSPGDVTICELHYRLEADSGSPPDMVAMAEHLCQGCGKVSWSKVPRRTDTMPPCECGGRRQIVRIRHRPRNADRRGDLSDERARE
jgi:hypothetical protein